MTRNYRYNSETLWRLHEIGGADLALQYAEMSERATERREPEQPREVSLRSLQFYSGSPEAPSPGEREYGYFFPRSKTQYVYYEIELNNPWQFIDWSFDLQARFVNPDGTTDEVSGKYEAPEGTEWFRYSAGVGWDQPGLWAVGMYTVEILVDFKSIATGTFWINQDAPSGWNTDWSRNLAAGVSPFTWVDPTRRER